MNGQMPQLAQRTFQILSGYQQLLVIISNF